MRKNKKIRFGLIGAGAIAQTWASAFEHSKTSQLIAVADLQEERALTFAEEFKCQSFRSYEKMLQNCSLEAVIVCTPPVCHPEISIYCMEKNIHVLCEKPLSIDERSARAMLRTAKRKRIHLIMASKFRYVPDVVFAKKIVESGWLGEVVLFENSFVSAVDMSGRWNSDPRISGGGVLIDNGTHSVDIAHFFLGPMDEIRVTEGKRKRGLPVEEAVRMFINFKNGARGKIGLSWNSMLSTGNYILIRTTRGFISVGWKESKYCQNYSSDWVVFGKGYNKLEAFCQQLNNFSKAIMGKETLRISCEEALASVRVIEAGYKSIQEKQWVTVDPKYHHPEEQHLVSGVMKEQRV